MKISSVIRLLVSVAIFSFILTLSASIVLAQGEPVFTGTTVYHRIVRDNSVPGFDFIGSRGGWPIFNHLLMRQYISGQYENPLTEIVLVELVGFDFMSQASSPPASYNVAIPVNPDEWDCVIFLWRVYDNRGTGIPIGFEFSLDYRSLRPEFDLRC